jgi:hypothetical protein
MFIRARSFIYRFEVVLSRARVARGCRRGVPCHPRRPDWRNAVVCIDEMLAAGLVANEVRDRPNRVLATVKAALTG